MPSDISRTSDEQRYQGVVMQQGRVILDRDFNALRQTVDRRIEADALDFVGPWGTPDDGFLIGPPASPGSPPLWIPPSPLSPPDSNAFDFSISPGTMYVGGQRAEFPPFAPGQGAVGYSYRDQPDWINPPTPGNPAQEFIYLHLLESEVSAVEDPELKDVALGGPDTTQRIRVIRRVKRLGVSSADCDLARADASTHWQQNGLRFDSQTMRLIPQATLLVGFPPATNAPTPCDPVAQGGYLGAENQLIRVQITDGGVPNAKPTLLWGCDNASFLYRATVSNPASQGPTILVLGQSPVDEFHIPRQKQVVEILRSALVIDSEPDSINPQQSGAVVRCVAEARGFVCTIAAPYQDIPPTITVDHLPDEYRSDPNPLFVRIWQNQIPFTPDGVTPAELKYTDGNTTGLTVTIGIPSSGGQLQAPPIGAYWMIAVRPSTPQQVYPERFLVSPQPPDGPRQWACPLGTIDWSSAQSPPTSPVSSGAVFHSCRAIFDNLVELTKRNLGGCCSVTVRPEDQAADPLALQNAIDKFAGAAQGVAICLTPGTYWLTQPLQIDQRHTGITIEACHGAVTIQAAKPIQLKGAVPFLQGLMVISGCDSVTLRGITFNLPVVRLIEAIASLGLTGLRSVVASFPNPLMLIGLHLLDCTNLKVMDCKFVFAPTAGSSNFAAGILAHGNCTGLSVRQSAFTAPLRQPPPRRFPREPSPTLTSNIGALREELTAGAGSTVTAAATTGTGVASSVVANARPDVTGAAVTTPAPATPALSAATLNINDAITSLLTARNNALNSVRLSPGSTFLPPSIFFPPTQPPVPSMLAAFLMAPSQVGGTNDNGGLAPSTPRLVSQAILDQAVFSGNTMQGLTIAVLGAAAVGSVKFSDNTMTDCVGGIWLGGLVADNLVDLQTFQAFLTAFTRQGTNPSLALSLATNYPLPGDSTSTTAVSRSAQFFIVNNRIDALPGDGTTSGAACMLIVMPDTGFISVVESPADVTTSVVLNSNQMRSMNDASLGSGRIPQLDATVLLLGEGDMVVGANLIRNLNSDGVSADTGKSLFIVQGTGGTLAASGNVLWGDTNIDAIARPDVASYFTAQTLTAVPGLSKLLTWKFLNNALP